MSYYAYSIEKTFLESIKEGGGGEMDCNDTIVFENCEIAKCIEKQVCITDEGHLLIVPVTLCNVRPCKQVIVGVRICLNGEFYAMETKEVFTGGREYCREIKELSVGDFKFLFMNAYEKEVDIDVIAHYIGK